MSLFICPICSEPLEKNQKTYICKNHHSFDIASQGYVNLMPTEKSHENAGDNADMMIARREFLNTGAYSPLLDALKVEVEKLLKLKGESGKFKVFDAGCGEGYYTVGIKQYIESCGLNAEFAGIDIAKRGIRYAQNRDKDVSFAVAGIFNMPFKNDSADIILNIFAPVCEREFSRVLKSGGELLIVGPSKNHLFGLKKLIYDNPYFNEENIYDFNEFTHVEDIRVEGNIIVEGKNIRNLFTMTPYYFNTPQSEAKRLDDVEKLETPIDFVINVLRKK